MWRLEVKFLVGVLAALILGCTSPKVDILPTPLPQLDPPKITISLSQEISQFISWMNEEFPKIKKQLNIEGSPRFIFYTGLGPSKQVGEKFFNVLGMYTYIDKTIHIFWRFSYNGTMLQVSLPLEELKYTFYHEILHWYDDIMGFPSAPKDHNEIFDKRIRALGWLNQAAESN
jgi:hypothetical protein